MAMNDAGDNNASTKVMNLNSPEVIPAVNTSGNPVYISEDKDFVHDLPAELKEEQEATNSILLRDDKMKNESRRVSFPEDDKIISGYGEPRNPWAHAKTTSTEELIQAYTQSCQQWGVKPIIKLLVQLQEIKDFSVRSHSLTLKGEKLDSKVVETLEAIFKRVQFFIMDLEATNLNDDSAAALFDMVEYYESAVNVLVGFNKHLGTRGWQAAAHMMRKMSCLRLFDSHSVPLSEEAVPFVGRALRLSHTLVTLHLEGASLSGRPMLLILSSLRMNVTLRELFLADNQLISTDALQIANLLKFNAFLQLLDIRNNHIQDAGLCHLCSGLMNQPRTEQGGLQTLVLWNNQLSHQSMKKLATSLGHTTSLSTLNLGQNVLGDDGASKLKDGLLKNRSLLRLGMVGTKLTCEGAIALAEFLAESPRIIRLDMRNNDVRVGGLMALSLAFKINDSLLRLDIDKPKVKDVPKELVETQDSLMTDIGQYTLRNKDRAVQRALDKQVEHVKRSVENNNPGLRYMDMTNSAIAAASNSRNNSNNKLAANTASGLESRLLSTHVDDSPINSPEFLPTNSVSYHQVSPVMISSCEMEKRAAESAEIVTSADVEEPEDDQSGERETTASQALSASDQQTSEEKESNDLESSDKTEWESTSNLVASSKLSQDPDFSDDTKSCKDDGNVSDDVIATDLVSEPAIADISAKEARGETYDEGGDVSQDSCESNAYAKDNIDENNTNDAKEQENVADINDSSVTVTHFDLSLFPKD